jgi:hypothetical protein
MAWCGDHMDIGLGRRQAGRHHVVGDLRRDLGQRPWRVLSVVDPATVAQLAQSGYELVKGRIECRSLVHRGGFGSNRWSPGAKRHLDSRGTVVLTRVSFVGDLHLHSVDLPALVVLVDALKLLDDVFSEPIRDFAVPALDDNFHVASRGREHSPTVHVGCS